MHMYINYLDQSSHQEKQGDYLKAWSISDNNVNNGLKVFFTAFLVENLTYSSVDPFLVLEKYTAQGLFRKKFLISQLLFLGT